MGKKSIYDKPPPMRPSQYRIVADRRFGDAQTLVDTGQNERANGAQYLAGYVVEILLKARLLDHPAIRDAKHGLHAKVRSAVYKQHDLEELLDLLNAWIGLDETLEARGRRAGVDYTRMLKKVCGEWTIHARYSTLSSTITNAKAFLADVRQLKEILK